VAQEHREIGGRIRDWAFEHHGEAVQAAISEVTGGREDLVLSNMDLHLITAWALGDRELPAGVTPVQRYAQREDLQTNERDVANRVAAARLGLLRVAGVQPGRWIELEELTGSELVLVNTMSHDVSRVVRPHDMILGRLMDGPPAPSLWGPVGILTRDLGRQLMALLTDRMRSLDLHEPHGLRVAIHAASREITMLLSPALRDSATFREAA
jgi:hypothetical protein